MKFDGMDMLTKLHDVSCQIVNTYDEAMDIIANGESLENTFLLTKLKILIAKENALINSIPKNKIEYCLALIEKLPLDYLEEKYGISEEDLFHFPSDECIEIRRRMKNKLFFRQQIDFGRCVTFDETLVGDASKKMQFPLTESVIALVAIEATKSLNDEFMQLVSNNEADEQFIRTLKIRLDQYLIKVLMEHSVVEYLVLYFNNDININEILDKTLDSIKLGLFTQQNPEMEQHITFLSLGMVSALSKMELDFNDAESVYEYMIQKTKFDTILNYATRDSVKTTERHFDRAESELGGFKSEYIKSDVRSLFNKHKERVYKHNQFFGTLSSEDGE